MKRVILKDRYNNIITVTKSLQGDCYVNHKKIDNIGIYELIRTYKYAGYKVSAYRIGQVYHWGSVCDMNDLTNFKTIYKL